MSTFPGPEAKYIQLAAQLRGLIESGELKAGDRLPSYTEMYSRFGATPATSQRVHDLLAEDNLIERRPGRGVFVSDPQRQVTGMIGFVGSTLSRHLSTSPFYSDLMAGIQRVLQDNGQQLVHMGSAEAWNEDAYAKVDGILLCNIEAASPVLSLLPPHLPRVSSLIMFDDISSVGVDDYRGAQLAVRHLLGLGHRKIACLMEGYLSEGRRRMAGYRDAMVEAGIDVNPSWTRMAGGVFDGKTNWKTAQPYAEWGRQEMTAWLQEGWLETGCTALLVQNEISAIAAMQILQMQGIDVPGDISIMGFDGTEICDVVSPTLCAVAVPLAEIGARAAELLNQRIAGDRSEPENIVLPVTIRPGGSVGPVAVR